MPMKEVIQSMTLYKRMYIYALDNLEDISKNCNVSPFPHECVAVENNARINTNTGIVYMSILTASRGESG